MNQVITYTYVASVDDQRPRTMEKKIAGVTVAKTYYGRLYLFEGELSL